MALTLNATATQPPIPDGTVCRLYNQGAASGPVLTGNPPPLESATMTAGTCSFATAVDGQVYAVAVVATGLNRWVLKSNPTTNQTTANARTTGATPETRRAALKAASSIVQT